MEKINKAIKELDSKIGPKNKKACQEDREMVLDCVINSECFKKYNHFRFCMQKGIDLDCKALRYNFYRCKRSQVYWEKSLRDDYR